MPLFRAVVGEWNHRNGLNMTFIAAPRILAHEISISARQGVFGGRPRSISDTMSWRIPAIIAGRSVARQCHRHKRYRSLATSRFSKERSLGQYDPPPRAHRVLGQHPVEVGADRSVRQSAVDTQSPICSKAFPT
jgi:hypothetical protein